MPANKVFLDTCGWLALLNASDVLHAQANETWPTLGKHGYVVYLTDWIVAETGNGLARSRNKRSFEEAVRRVLVSGRAEFVDVGEELLQRSLGRYVNREDKDWGLVDCLSFIVMEDNDVREAFTNDRHFEQAGFHCLLTES